MTYVDHTDYRCPAEMLPGRPDPVRCVHWRGHDGQHHGDDDSFVWGSLPTDDPTSIHGLPTMHLCFADLDARAGQPPAPLHPQLTLAVLDDVHRERAAQDAKWGEQNHPDGTGGKQSLQLASYYRDRCQAAAAAGTVSWRHILREEVFEAFAETDPATLRTELVQVAAVAIGWAEHIDRRTATDTTQTDDGEPCGAVIRVGDEMVDCSYDEGHSGDHLDATGRIAWSELGLRLPDPWADGEAQTDADDDPAELRHELEQAYADSKELSQQALRLHREHDAQRERADKAEAEAKRLRAKYEPDAEEVQRRAVMACQSRRSAKWPERRDGTEEAQS